MDDEAIDDPDRGLEAAAGIWVDMLAAFISFDDDSAGVSAVLMYAEDLRAQDSADLAPTALQIMATLARWLAEANAEPVAEVLARVRDALQDGDDDDGQLV